MISEIHQLSKTFYFRQVFLLQIYRWLSLWVELDFSQLPPITRQRDQNSQMINQNNFSHKTGCNPAWNSQCSHSTQDDEIITEEGNYSLTMFSYRENLSRVRDFHGCVVCGTITVREFCGSSSGVIQCSKVGK